MVVSSLWTAAGAVGSALRRTMLDLSGDAAADPFARNRQTIARLRGYYANELYGGETWRAYRAQYRLPRAADGVYNPTKRAVDFYAGRIYPGAWTEDGRPLPDGRPHAVQFAPDVVEGKAALVAAALQFLDWGNWQSARFYYVREGATVGTAFLELVDDPPDPAADRAGRVYPEVVPLERVAAVSLDPRGFVASYALEYRAADPDGRPYRYRKEVDKAAIRTYRDDRPDGFGDPEGPERENPYGFVPAWWVKHRNVGGVFGAPAIDGVVPKIDRVNAIASGVHGFVNRMARQPLYFRSDEPVTVTDLGLSGDDLDPQDRVLYLQGPRDSSVDWLMQPMPLADAGAEIDRLLKEVEADLPEIVMDDRLRGMSQVTGPGANAAMGDVRARFEEAQANYDAGLVRAMQAGVAIGGWRLGRGDWGRSPDRQQAKFAGFGLDSRGRGDLDLAVLPRLLVPPTETDRLEAMERRRRVADLSAAFVRRELGVFPGGEAVAAAQNEAMEAELADEALRRASAAGSLFDRGLGV